MKPITAYKAFDGRVFEEAENCANYETHCYALLKIVDKLPKFEKTPSYLLGDEYYQHDKVLYDEIVNEFIDYIENLYPNVKTMGDIRGMDRVKLFTWMTNLLTMSGDMPSMTAWKFIGIVDDEYRQWYDYKSLKEPNKKAKPVGM